MNIDEVIRRLRISLGAKISEQKSCLERKSIYYRNNEDFNTFFNIFMKSSYTNEDINDLLLFYSDSILSDEEIFSTALKNDDLFYDEEQFGMVFSVRNIVLYYLLSSKDYDLIIKLLKLFKLEDFRIKRNETLEDLYDISFGSSIYDLYLAFKNLEQVTDLDLKRKKTAVLMSYLDGDNLSKDIKKLGISLSDVEAILTECDLKAPITVEEAYRLLSSYMSFNKRKIGNDELDDKVFKAYQSYCSLHITFLDSDFIDYYNNTYGDDFSSFYYNVSEKTLLNADLLYSIIKKYSMPSAGYKTNYVGEYASRYQMFSEYNERRKAAVEKLSDSNKVRYENILRVLEKYAEFFDTLSHASRFSLSYLVFTNVDSFDYDYAMEIVEWYRKNDKSKLGENAITSKEQKQNVKEDLLSKCKDEILANFGNRVAIVERYKSLIHVYVAKNAMSKSAWNRYLTDLETEYYANEGIRFIKILIDTIDKNESVLLMVRELDIEFKLMTYVNAVSSFSPNLANAADLVLTTYLSELRVEKERNYVQQLKDEAERCAELVSRFLTKKYKSREAFLEEENLTEAQFEKILANVEKNDFLLYAEFMNKFNSLKSQRYLILMKIVDYVLNGLVNGIEENGVLRPFHFMDYCLVTKLDIDKFAIVAKKAGKINATNVRQFKEFERKIKGYSMISNQHIIEDKHIVVIDGALHEVTEEEKKMALRFLRIKGLDNYYVLYKKALSMVLSGELTQEKLDIMDESGKKAKALA